MLTNLYEGLIKMEVIIKFLLLSSAVIMGFLLARGYSASIISDYQKSRRRGRRLKKNFKLINVFQSR
jgi:hypothetical protein